MQEDPTFRVHTDKDTGPDHHLRHGRAAPRDHRRPPGARVQRRRQRRQAAGRLQGDDHPGGRAARGATSARPAAAASTATPRSTCGRPPRATSSSTTRSSAASIPKEFIKPIEQGIKEALETGPLAGLPVHRGRGRPLRGELPRRRLVRDRVQDRRLDGLPGRLQAGAAGLMEPVMAVEVVTPEDYMGDGHRRHHLAARPHPEHGGARQRPGDHLQGAALRDVRLRDRPALDVPGARPVHDAVRRLRAGSEERQ